MDIGSALGRAAGISEEQIRTLAHYRQSSAFSPTEQLVLDYACAMTRTPVEVPDELFAALRATFDEPQIIELTAAIAWENYRARFDHALDIGAQGFSEGAVCALPERASG
jgi:4-carboxymuconolactone decarboxylase